LLIAYRKQNYPHPDDAPISVMQEILAGGQVSPLYTELVKKQRIAAGVSYFEAPGSAYPNLTVFEVIPKAPHTNDQILHAFDREITRFKKKEVSQEALMIAKRSIAMSTLGRLQSNMTLARDFAAAELLYGDWQANIRCIIRVRIVLFTVGNQQLG